MATYSINISQPTEATSDTSYDVVYNTGVPNIISLLSDNDDKEVSPKDIRDAILSTWYLPAFKETSSTQSGNISYVGVDSGNPSDRDVKNKIYFGKRQYFSKEIMNSSLLTNDVDVFFFNTKIDTISQLKTRLSLLAGTNFTLHNKAPYIQSQVSSATAGQVLSLDIVNQTGDININSQYSNVIIGTVSYPTTTENGASASPLRVLRYNNGNLYWDDISVNFYNTVGATGSPLNIFGTPVLINGYPIELTSNKPTPLPIGGMAQGRTFSSVPVVELLREILYPYLKPLVTLTINKSVTEYGTYPSIYLNYSVTKRTFNLNYTTLSNMIPGSIPPISSNGHLTVTGSASGVYISNTNTTFQITANDGTQSVSASQSLKFVYPYFHGLLSSPVINFAGLSTLNKTVDPQNDQIVSLLGSGYIYFIYDNSYPLLNKIFDENNNEIYGASSSWSSFTYSVVTLTSPSWLWASHQFKVYRSMTSSYSFSPPAINYQFKF